jgi:hypothetical protein
MMIPLTSLPSGYSTRILSVAFSCDTARAGVNDTATIIAASAAAVITKQMRFNPLPSFFTFYTPTIKTGEHGRNSYNCRSQAIKFFSTIGPLIVLVISDSVTSIIYIYLKHIIAW